MALLDIQIQQLYTAYLGRPADQAGINYWQEANVSESELRANLANDNQPEYVELYGDRTREELVTAIYENMFGREPEEAGLEYWVSGDGASVPASELQQLFISAASEEDAATFNARVQEDLGNVEPLPPQPGTDESIPLTQQADDLEGADGVDTTFVAPVTQNETGSGQLANTFETGDVLDGGTDSNNTLRADLIATGTIQDNHNGVAVSAETNNVQNVFLRAQAMQNDAGGSNTTYAATVDAEKMAGVEQWWTDNSRADVRIEDIRTRPVDTIFGMESTDPAVGYEAYFNPLFMEGGQTSESQLVIQIAELTNGVVNTEAQLANISVNSLSFELGDEKVTLSSDAMAAANTWEELEVALVEALAEEGLSDLEVTLGQDGQFLLFDAEGRAFSDQGGFTASATTNQQIDIRNSITQEIATQDEPTQTTLILDGAGNGSQGGDVNIAAMSGDRGVEVFDVEVDRSSHIETLRSVNNPTNSGSYSQENMLEVVNLTHVEDGAQGIFQLGNRTVDAQGVSTKTDDRLETNGLEDVRVFDATGYASAIKLGATLSNSVFDKYLADAEETIQFSYLLGDGGNNLSLEVDNDVASDPDFALEIVGGNSDDRINLTDLQFKNSTSINGDEGSNTVEVDTTTGAAAGGNNAAQNSWSSFENIQTLVVAGENDTVQNLVVGNMASLEQVVVATEGGVDTNVQQMRMDQDLTISGKNQTLGAGNSNEGQDFGTVAITNTSAVPGVESFEVLLENTARVDETLSVSDLVVNGSNSAIRTLDVVSSGRRETSNVVNAFNGEAVTALNLTGSQDLSFNVETMATSPASGGTPPLSITGAELGGNLTLAINAGNLVRENQDVVTGAAGDNDVLQVYGAIDSNAVVSAFETIQFGADFANASTASGTFNAVNTSGVELYNVVALDDALTIENLRAVETVRINAETANEDVTLDAASRGLENTLNVTIDARASGVNYDSDLAVNDFRAINLSLQGTGNEVNAFSPDLILNGYVSGGDDFANYARSLTVDGGSFNGQGANRTNVDTLTVDELSHSLREIDFSGFQGNVVGSFGDVLDEDGAAYGDQQEFNSNTVIRVSEFGFEWDNNSVADIDTVTTFRFTADSYSDDVVWQIDDFKSFLETSDLSNVDILDLRDLGIEGLADISIDYVAADQTATITSNADQNFTIELTGVTEALNNENFIFAS